MSLYLTTTDPDVIATIRRNREAKERFMSRAHEWAAERGSEDGAFFPSTFAGRLSVRGLPIQPEGFGRWTKGDARGCHWPYRNNEDERRAMASLSVTKEDVPGIPDALHAPGYLLWPTPFEHLGTAWICYSQMLDAGEREKIGAQWVECLASEWHAAHEGWMADR